MCCKVNTKTIDLIDVNSFKFTPKGCSAQKLMINETLLLINTRKSFINIKQTLINTTIIYWHDMKFATNICDI